MKKVRPTSTTTTDKGRYTWLNYDEWTLYKSYMRHKNKECIKFIIKEYNEHNK